ncbi:hypothetical protein OsJ_01835 [Oryza sativa Japonica Group]|uniref:Uncharacterized protein n=1 Tax=Oryza sativa subsp. japonica TaxID=39947 RepID=B9EWU8_ORYSJ|nr:hypothetical protein OsJ_01835 [Oryza sativa Japonica Group]
MQCRPNWEGGQYEGDDATRFEALRLAMELGVNYVDIELKVADKFISFIYGSKPEKCKLIVSAHNYESTPSCEELADLVARIQAVGADIVKIATTANDIVDVSQMFQVMVHCQGLNTNRIGAKLLISVPISGAELWDLAARSWATQHNSYVGRPRGAEPSNLSANVIGNDPKDLSAN